MLEGPDDGVQDQLELGRRDGEEGRETLGVDCLEQVEEVGAVLWVLLKVLGEQRSGYRPDALYSPAGEGDNKPGAAHSISQNMNVYNVLDKPL